MVELSVIYSLDELKALIRKMEFYRTDPQLLLDLINKAKTLGESERRRLKRLGRRARELSRVLDKIKFCRFPLLKDINGVKDAPAGAVDGSFQITGGIGGTWYVMVGAAYVIAPRGFGGAINYKVSTDMVVARDPDESSVKRKAEILMMLLETKCIRLLRNELSTQGGGTIFIDGPIMDPPWYFNRDYISDRARVIKESLSSNIRVLGIIKRVMGSLLLHEVRKVIDQKLLEEYTCDRDFISLILNYSLIRGGRGPVFTKPLEYPRRGANLSDYDKKTYKLYKMYLNEGIYIYYSYFKNSVRDRVYRVELATEEELSEKELDEEYMKIAQLIALWSLPGFSIPLLVMIAHDKCNIRKGAAETLYYEIIAKMLNQEELMHWTSLLSG